MWVSRAATSIIFLQRTDEKENVNKISNQRNLVSAILPILWLNLSRHFRGVKLTRSSPLQCGWERFARLASAPSSNSRCLRSLSHFCWIFDCWNFVAVALVEVEFARWARRRPTPPHDSSCSKLWQFELHSLRIPLLCLITLLVLLFITNSLSLRNLEFVSSSLFVYC